jgi:hypothetical protein
MLKIYDEYKKYGVENYYKLHNKQYFNPHLNKIEIIYKKYLIELVESNTSIIDIACGDGLISQLAIKYNNNRYVEGTDPYFNNKYTKYNYSFEDIAIGRLEKSYDMAICCYAYHLINPEWEFNFLNELANLVKKFIIITQSKKISINHYAWKRIKELRDDKITLIILQSNILNE